MAYVPNPTDVTNPTDSIPAETAAPEFRALKAYIASLAGLGSGMNLFRKNKVINGDFLIDQRAEGAAIALTNSGVYVTDGWFANKANASTIVAERSITNVFPGFLSCLVLTNSAAGAAVATESTTLCTVIEGLDTTELAWGTAAALPITISFWINSFLTGIHCISIKNSGDTGSPRTYVATFNVPVAGTQQYVSITVPGDTTAPWLYTSGLGIEISLDLGSWPATYNTPAANSWQAGNYNNVAGSVSINATTGQLTITGVQVEQANAASPFERLPYQQRLAICERRYRKSFQPGTAPAQNIGTNNGALLWQQIVAGASTFMGGQSFPAMRATPTVVFYNPVATNAQVRDFTGSYDLSATVAYQLGNNAIHLSATGNGSSAAGDIIGVHFTANADYF